MQHEGFKVECAHCGRETAGRRPAGGDGTFYFPRAHKFEGQPCPGNLREGIWKTLPPKDGRPSAAAR
jgi:hypothetical protein